MVTLSLPVYNPPRELTNLTAVTSAVFLCLAQPSKALHKETPQFSLLGNPPLRSFCHFPVILLNEAYFSFASSLDCPHLYSSLARDSKLESPCPKSTFSECGCLTPSRVKSHRAEKNPVTLSTTLYGSVWKKKEREATEIAQNKQKIKTAPAE